MATEATRQQSLNYGCVVEDNTDHTVLHYVEKPGTYVSTSINCGVYIFSKEVFPMLKEVFKKKQARLGSKQCISDILTPFGMSYTLRLI